MPTDQQDTKFLRRGAYARPAARLRSPGTEIAHGECCYESPAGSNPRRDSQPAHRAGRRRAHGQRDVPLDRRRRAREAHLRERDHVASLRVRARAASVAQPVVRLDVSARRARRAHLRRAPERSRCPLGNSAGIEASVGANVATRPMRPRRPPSWRARRRRRSSPRSASAPDAGPACARRHRCTARTPST